MRKPTLRQQIKNLEFKFADRAKRVSDAETLLQRFVHRRKLSRGARKQLGVILKILHVPTSFELFDEALREKFLPMVREQLEKPSVIWRFK